MSGGGGFGVGVDASMEGTLYGSVCVGAGKSGLLEVLVSEKNTPSHVTVNSYRGTEGDIGHTQRALPLGQRHRSHPGTGTGRLSAVSTVPAERHDLTVLGDLL